MSFIQIPGLADNDPVPGVYASVQFAQGQASSGTTNYTAVLLGNRLSTGTAQDDGYVYGPDTQTQLLSEADAITLFGAGSELHAMWRRFNAVNKTTSLYAVCVKESSGSQATGTIVITGPATVSATVRVFVGTYAIDTGVVSGDTATIIGTNIVSNINALSWLQVTASGTSTVTLTAKQKGLRGNDIGFQAQVLGSSTGVSVTSTNNTRLSGGTTQDSNTNALATIANTRFYYQVSAAHDASQWGSLATQIDSNASPIIGIRCRSVAGSIDTLANTITLSTGVNSARDEIIWQQNSDFTPAELAANNAAIYALQEQTLSADHGMNFDGFGNDSVTSASWFVPAPRDGTVVTRASVKSALLNGITPLGVSRPGKSFLVKRVTSRSLSGAVADYRIRDAHKVTVCDFFTDDVIVAASLGFSGKVVGNDPGPGQVPPGSLVVTPRVFKSLISGLVVKYGNNSLLQNVAAILAATVVVKETSPPTRISALIPLQPIDILDQVGVVVNQVA